MDIYLNQIFKATYGAESTQKDSDGVSYYGYYTSNNQTKGSSANIAREHLIPAMHKSKNSSVCGRQSMQNNL